MCLIRNFSLVSQNFFYFYSVQQKHLWILRTTCYLLFPLKNIGNIAAYIASNESSKLVITPSKQRAPSKKLKLQSWIKYIVIAKIAPSSPVTMLLHCFARKGGAMELFSNKHARIGCIPCKKRGLVPYTLSKIVAVNKND